MNKWDKRNLELAKTVANYSKDPSTKVGCVIIRSDNTIASTGFNGFPRQMEDRPEWYTDKTEKYSRVIHAELNAILNAHGPVDEYIAFIYPCPPCDRCAVTLIQAGITKVIYQKPSEEMAARWDFTRPLTYLKDCGVIVEELNINE